MESQVRILKDYSFKNDIINYELSVDEGISGTKSSRPSFDRMMLAVKERQIESVIVYSFSRFARSTTHLLNALLVFEDHNVAFVSIIEKIDTSTPVGVAVFSILAAWARPLTAGPRLLLPGQQYLVGQIVWNSAEAFNLRMLTLGYAKESYI